LLFNIEKENQVGATPRLSRIIVPNPSNLYSTPTSRTAPRSWPVVGVVTDLLKKILQTWNKPCPTKEKTLKCYLFRSGISKIGFEGSIPIATKNIYRSTLINISLGVNRRNHRRSILDKIIERCAAHQPVTFEQIRIIYAT
tara:strand:+ start:15157 stop:15579 length:423 start_codon:yes stop_codon:yes gene_type:complete